MCSPRGLPQACIQTSPWHNRVKEDKQFQQKTEVAEQDLLNSAVE